MPTVLAIRDMLHTMPIQRRVAVLELALMLTVHPGAAISLETSLLDTIGPTAGSA